MGFRSKTMKSQIYCWAKLLLICLCCIGSTSKTTYAQDATLPEGFVHIHEVIPNIVYDIRYFSTYNFVGKPIDGYQKGVAILSEPAAMALKKVQEALNRQELGLVIYDAYRPQRAVNHFIRWARVPGDTLTKAAFYPDLPKSRLFQLGYIASRSGHSRGSTVDLSIIDLASGAPLDMGSTFDFFGKVSHHKTAQINEEQKANRLLLKQTMMQFGFLPYSEEWWHYTLSSEPYPETYFDFLVR